MKGVSLPDELIDDLYELLSLFFGENGGKRPFVFYDDAFGLSRIFLSFGGQFYAGDPPILPVRDDLYHALFFEEGDGPVDGSLIPLQFRADFLLRGSRRIIDLDQQLHLVHFEGEILLPKNFVTFLQCLQTKGPNARKDGDRLS